MTTTEREAVVIVDLGFGDQCKGSICDHYARRRNAHTVVRFNGGAQAGHNVVTSDGRHHTYSQFSSASFVPTVRTHLSRYMILDPLSMLFEERHLREVGVENIFARTTISENALVITPFHRSANRLREFARGANRHGSCGIGIGETVSDALGLGAEAIRVRDLNDPKKLADKLKHYQDYKRRTLSETIDQCRPVPEAAELIQIYEAADVIPIFIEMLQPFVRQARVVPNDYLGEILNAPGCVIFEGAQGVLLDEGYGFHPHTTWSTCTSKNANTLLREYDYDGRVERVGVLRAYSTRHGEGPFVTEDFELAAQIPDTRGLTNDWHNPFRIGWLDLVATKYSLEVCGDIDYLAMSCLDRLEAIPEWRVASAYTLPKTEPEADRHFAKDKGLLKSIKVDPYRDLNFQEQLTRLLLKAKPVYETSAASPNFETRVVEHLSRISTELAVPIKIASFGPTANDKRECSF